MGKYRYLCFAVVCFFVLLLQTGTLRSRHLHQFDETIGDAAQEGGVRTVRVAAVQCYSRMTKLVYNRQMLAGLIRKAAGQKAKVVVLPECAVHGYMNPATGLKWAADPRDPGELPVALIAEPVPGRSTRFFGDLARELSIYLALPLIESHDGKYFNTLVLLDPSGKVVAHHRKRSMWMEGDGQCFAKGDTAPQVVSTPYGNIGIMICHDVHVMPPLLKKGGAQIVLYAVGWYGPNTESWFRQTFPDRYVVPNGFAVVAANWCADTESDSWNGQGYSCIIERDGTVVSMAKNPDKAEIIIGDLRVSRGGDTEAAPTDE